MNQTDDERMNEFFETHGFDQESPWEECEETDRDPDDEAGPVASDEIQINLQKLLHGNQHIGSMTASEPYTSAMRASAFAHKATTSAKKAGTMATHTMARKAHQRALAAHRRALVSASSSLAPVHQAFADIHDEGARLHGLEEGRDA